MFDVICTGMALVDSIIRGFDPNPISASGYIAASGSLNVGGGGSQRSDSRREVGPENRDRLRFG